MLTKNVEWNKANMERVKTPFKISFDKAMRYNRGIKRNKTKNTNNVLLLIVLNIQHLNDVINPTPPIPPMFLNRLRQHEQLQKTFHSFFLSRHNK